MTCFQSNGSISKEKCFIQVPLLEFFGQLGSTFVTWKQPKPTMSCPFKHWGLAHGISYLAVPKNALDLYVCFHTHTTRFSSTYSNYFVAITLPWSYRTYCHSESFFTRASYHQNSPSFLYYKPGSNRWLTFEGLGDTMFEQMHTTLGLVPS